MKNSSSKSQADDFRQFLSVQSDYRFLSIMNIRFAPSSLKKGKPHHKFHEQNMHPFGTRLIQFPFITAQVHLFKREGIQFGREGSCGKFEFYLKQEGERKVGKTMEILLKKANKKVASRRLPPMQQVIFFIHETF